MATHIHGSSIVSSYQKHEYLQLRPHMQDTSHTTTKHERTLSQTGIYHAVHILPLWNHPQVSLYASKSQYTRVCANMGSKYATYTHTWYKRNHATMDCATLTNYQ